MDANVDFPAHLVILAFLGAAATLILLMAAALVGCFLRRPKLAKRSGVAALAVLLLYAGALLGVSLLSHEKTLARGQEKYLCELDCHLAYSVESVERTKVWKDGDTMRAAKGEWWIVALRTRFDEKTVSSRRPLDAPLTPNPRLVTLMDREEIEYPFELRGAPLDQPLRPGESHVTYIAADLPTVGVAPPVRLLVREGIWPSRLVIGSEISPLHARTYFALR